MRVTTLILPLLAVIFASSASAQKFPTRDITLVVQFAPGGNTDVNARLLAPYLSKELGVPVIVENRASGGGYVAINSVYRANPDGYTLLLNVFPQNAQKEIVFDVPFRILELTYLANYTKTDMFVAVAKDSPYNNLKDLLEASRKKPLNVSVSQLGSAAHLNAMILKRRLGVNLEVIPYPGGAQAMAAMLGGHVDFISSDDITVWLQRESVRPLVAFSDQRSAKFPEVPTLGELGEGTVSYSLIGIAGPAGMPEDIQKILSAALAKAIQNPELIEKVQKSGGTVKYLPGPDFYNAARSFYKLVTEYKDIFEEKK